MQYLKKVIHDIRLRYYMVLEPSFQKIVILLEVDFHFKIPHDDTLNDDGSPLLSFPLQAGASDKTVPVGASILKGCSPPLAPNSHLYVNRFGGLEVSDAFMGLNILYFARVEYFSNNMYYPPNACNGLAE